MPTYSDAELLAEIRRVAAITDGDGAPSVSDFNTHSDINDSTIYRRFGSWNDAVADAGFDPNPAETSGVAEADLIAELHRLRDAVGHIPVVREMNADGEYWVSTYRDHFGSWTDALVASFDDIEDADELSSLRASDRPPLSDDAQFGAPREHSDEELLAELTRLADTHHDPPRMRDVTEHSPYGAATYTRRFGSWSDALRKAGFEPRPNRVSTDELLADLHRLRDELGTRPTADDVVDEGAHGIATYQRRFGSWSAAVEIAFEDDSTAATNDTTTASEGHDDESRD